MYHVKSVLQLWDLMSPWFWRKIEIRKKRMTFLNLICRNREANIRQILDMEPAGKTKVPYHRNEKNNFSKEQYQYRGLQLRTAILF